MAEGDSILRLARRLEGTLAGSALAARTPGPRRPTGLSLDRIDGSVLERVESRGKHLLFHFDRDTVLHSHLGMRGSWHLYAARERWRRPPAQAWIVLAGDGSEAVNFGGSLMRIATEGQLRRDPRLARLGPDLLAADFDAAAAARAVHGAGPQVEIGEALLNQTLVAGIGNIFKSEGCFEAGINPCRRLESLSDEELKTLLATTRGLMLEAVETGHQPHRVYREAGRPCPRCRTTIRSRAQGESARLSYWCPACQPG
jgi:endonuclease-8